MAYRRKRTDELLGDLISSKILMHVVFLAREAWVAGALEDQSRLPYMFRGDQFLAGDHRQHDNPPSESFPDSSLARGKSAYVE